ncbi:MFS general substrate transporter [Mycena indigotica]|uniref:MFS general substrate transporter n=1 Tax=Mycena indigotica TaxID=2126181 RepID=A0A8H6TDJ5_9AGAR|nr:MFS general substrate transporter [Mycena indigotica]KAF7315495.1 MFS general substrate transporter [Mycena indigotica]
MATNDKADEERIEKGSGLISPPQHGDAALEILGDGATRHEITDEQSAAVLRKIDRYVLPVMLMVYFLQQLDKSSLSYTSVFGIVAETGLVGTQYSWLNSIVYVAQLIWQPCSSYFLVRLPLSKYLFVNVFMWGAVVAATSAAKNFGGLLAARFFLGLFEATVAPCFITITQMWWRRREQTLRLSYWFAMNGCTGMVGSLLTYGLGHIHGRLHSYQVIFLFIGLLTVVCSPVVYFALPDSPTKARFLNHEEKVVAIERLRANNQGTETKVWKWDQVLEVFLDIKTYLWFSLLFLCAVPSGGIGSFGPLIIQGFGFSKFNTILFNIPFAALQIVLTISGATISTKIKLKWPVIFGFALPPIAGASALMVLGRGAELRNKLLACYYVLSFFSVLQPLLYTWSSQNVAGHTKKTCNTGLVFVAQCAGNILGPLVYKTEEKPYYRSGLICDLICWIALAVLVLITAAYLHYLNGRHAKRRVALGKTKKVVDTSLESASEVKRRAAANEGEADNLQSFDDLTDLRNEDFIYVLPHFIPPSQLDVTRWDGNINDPEAFIMDEDLEENRAVREEDFEEEQEFEDEEEGEETAELEEMVEEEEEPEAAKGDGKRIPLPPKKPPTSPSFYSGRAAFYDQLSQIESAVQHTRSALQMLQLLPLPDFARRSLPVRHAIWKSPREIAGDLGVTMSSSRYRILTRQLGQLNEYLRIAEAAGCDDLAERTRMLLNLFESASKEAALTRGKRKRLYTDQLGRSYTFGKRKTSTARVWMVPVIVKPQELDVVDLEKIQSLDEAAALVTSQPDRFYEPQVVPNSTILINNIPLGEFFPVLADRERVVRPLKIAGLLSAYNIFTLVRGGGTTGQSGALAHGIAKGLIVHEPSLETLMRRTKLLRRDPRMVERKKPGLAKARKGYTWVKR